MAIGCEVFVWQATIERWRWVVLCMRLQLKSKVLVGMEVVDVWGGRILESRMRSMLLCRRLRLCPPPASFTVIAIILAIVEKATASKHETCVDLLPRCQDICAFGGNEAVSE